MMSPIPVPPWVSALGSVSPLVVGILGVILGRKTKAATDELKFSDFTSRLKHLEGVQAEHVVSIAKIQQTVGHVQRVLARIEDTSESNGQMISEVRGMLYQMNGRETPPVPKPRRRVVYEPEYLDAPEPI